MRKALYQAIDIDSIQRHHAWPEPAHGCLVAPRLLAGRKACTSASRSILKRRRSCWPKRVIHHGFEVDFACPNNRYINDEEICQAVTAMWAKVGIGRSCAPCHW